MIPPIFSICAASAAVRAALGSAPVRLYAFGMVDAERPPAAPYAVWQGFDGSAERYLDRVPDVDYFSTQVDVYADTSDALLSAARALRDAIEPHAYITRWSAQGTDPPTKRLRFSFDVDWIVTR